MASVVLLKLHGCVVSHMQVLATTLLSVHNLLNTHFAGPLQLTKKFKVITTETILVLAACSSGSDVGM